MTNWTKYTHARDADGKTVPVEFLYTEYDGAHFKLLGSHTTESGSQYPSGEGWHFRSGGNNVGLTLLTAAEAEQDPPEWAKDLFKKRAGMGTVQGLINEGARTIAKYEDEPEDPDMALAVETVAQYWEGEGCLAVAARIRDRFCDDKPNTQVALFAIKAVRKELAQ